MFSHLHLPRPQALLFVLSIAAAGWSDCGLLGEGRMALKAFALFAVPFAAVSLRRKAPDERRRLGSFALLFAFPLLFSLLHSLLVWSLHGVETAFLLRACQKLLFQAAALMSAMAAFSLWGARAIDWTFGGLALANGTIILLHALSASPSAVLTALSFGPLLGLGGEAGAFQTSIELHDITFCMGLFVLYYALYNPSRGDRRAFVAAALFFFHAGFKRIAILALLLALAAGALVFPRRRPLSRARPLAFGALCVALGFAFVAAVRFGLLTRALGALGIDMAGRDKIYRYVKPMYVLSPAFLGHGFQYTVALLRGMREAGNQAVMVTGVHSDVLTLYIEMGFFGFFAVMGYHIAFLPARLGARYGAQVWRGATAVQLYLLVTFLTDNTMYYFFVTLVSRLMLMGVTQAKAAPLFTRTPARSPSPSVPDPPAFPAGRKSSAMPHPSKPPRRALALCLLAVCAALLCAGAQRLYASRHACVTLTLRDPAAASGRRPDGTRLDVAALFDDEVLGKAIARAGATDNLDAASLKAALRIAPVVTRDPQAGYVCSEYTIELAHRDAPALMDALTAACLTRESRRMAGSMLTADAGALQDALLSQHIQSRALEAPDFVSGGDSFASLSAELRAGCAPSALRERAAALESAFLAVRAPLSFRKTPDSAWKHFLPLLAAIASASAAAVLLFLRRLWTLPRAKPLLRAALPLLLANLLSAAAFFAWFSDGETQQGAILFSASEALQPDDLLRVETVERAIARLALPLGVEDVRSRIQIEPVIPEDERIRRLALLNDGKAYPYEPSDFIVSFTVDSDLRALSGMGGKRLARQTLDALTAGLIDSLAEREADTALAQVLPPAGQTAEARLAALSACADAFAEEAGAWRAYDTGCTFSAIALRAGDALAHHRDEADELDALLRETAKAYAEKRLLAQGGVRSTTHVVSSGGFRQRVALFAAFLLVCDGLILFLASLRRTSKEDRA